MDSKTPDVPGLDVLVEQSFEVFESTNSFARVKEHLLSGGLDEEAARYVVRLVDEFVTERDQLAEKKRHARTRLFIGLGFTAFGLINLLLTSVYESKGGLLRYSVYLLVAVGLLILWRAWNQTRRLNREDLEIDDSKFRLEKRFPTLRGRRY
jgi:hypothetical protein